jgi:hypothetical protein
MNAHVRDALVTDFQPLIDVLGLPEPDDRHVLAAAIKGRADPIVTINSRTPFLIYSTGGESRHSTQKSF